MDNKEEPLDIYLMGIGGTGMGAFAGLLQQKGHRVCGSDSAVYSPMKEKLAEWKINYKTPYHKNNLPSACDLVIIGNVIRRENPEALAVVEKNFKYLSFPHALNLLFLQQAIPIVAAGTHGKTTCSALMAHTLFYAGCDPGFLVGGIPRNFNESFRVSQTPGKRPFVVEGDEYDTAFFDKRPKFVHYDPQYLLLTSLEFDHGDIYNDIEAIIDAFANLLSMLTPNNILVIYGIDENIRESIRRSKTTARILSYGPHGDYYSEDEVLDHNGISFAVNAHGRREGRINIPLFGEHNLKNALGCYAILREFGLTHEQIHNGFSMFMGVKRRMEERFIRNDLIVVDDFAHHPSAVLATIQAAKLKYPHHKICAIFEPRSATSCMKIFEDRYAEAFLQADRVMLAPVGRNLPEDQRIDTEKIVRTINSHGVCAQAFNSYDDMEYHLNQTTGKEVLLFMSNGSFQGMLARFCS